MRSSTIDILLLLMEQLETTKYKLCRDYCCRTFHCNTRLHIFSIKAMYVRKGIAEAAIADWGGGGEDFGCHTLNCNTIGCHANFKILLEIPHQDPDIFSSNLDKFEN